MRRILTACLVLGLGASLSPAQSSAPPTQPPTTLQVESQIVLLDVSVTDANGKPVTDLRPEEFRITEKNVPQTIASFEPPSAHILPAADAGKVLVNSTADLGKIGQAPVTLIVIDELDMTFAARAYARTRLIEWLKCQPEALAQPTALLAINDKDLHLLRDYTQDREELLDVMNKHTGDVVWRMDPNSTSASTQENMGAVLAAIDQLAQATRGIPGRKNLLWVGRGFPAVGISDVGVNSAGAVNAQLRYLSDLLMQARVTLSVIGPTLSASEANLFNSTLAQGGTQTLADQTQTDTNMSAFNNGDGALKFFALSVASGGHSHSARNDIDAEIARSVDEGATYYTLSYRPTNVSNDPKAYRKIRVMVTRPGLTVQTREGYFAQQEQPVLSAKQSTRQLAFDLNGAATSPLTYTDLHVTAERSGRADFILHATARDLTWHDLPDGRRHADVVLLAACLSARGKLLSKSFATLGSNTEASLASIGISTAALPMHVIAPPGTARIRFVVRDLSNGRVGTTDVAP
jgi:VWFA-related protein